MEVLFRPMPAIATGGRDEARDIVSIHFKRRYNMNNKNSYHFHTKVIHAGQSPGDWDGATQPPIFQTASHQHETAENLSRTFSGKTNDHIYMRLTNPTNRILEEKLVALEGGQGAVVMSSGMAAITNACMALLRAEDEFVTGNSLFMSTYLLFTNIFKKYNITARLVESTDADAIEKAINSRTRFVYIETIGNPKMDIPDLARIAGIAHSHGIPLLVDNTLPTPYLCRPFELGADVVIHSTTKYLSGHGNAVGGAVIDSGGFDWSGERFPDFKPFIDRKGALAFLDKVWREHHINFGTTQAPIHSYLTMIGLDTLALRMERHMENAQEVARFLDKRQEVTWINYPGLKDHPSHSIARKQFGDKGFGGMLAFGLKDQATCFEFIQGLKLIYHLANLGDCKTLVIHPYSSQYVSFDDPTRESLSITADMIRLSVGIEDVGDICEDLGQALDKIK
jgi:O-acetylhomoserine (thiol)-lyase